MLIAREIDKGIKMKIKMGQAEIGGRRHSLGGRDRDRGNNYDLVGSRVGKVETENGCGEKG